jgi:hypothetical protein
MSAIEITKGKSSSEQASLPRVYADRSMPSIIIAGKLRLLAWDANRLLAVAAQA